MKVIADADTWIRQDIRTPCSAPHLMRDDSAVVFLEDPSNSESLFSCFVINSTGKWFVAKGTATKRGMKEIPRRKENPNVARKITDIDVTEFPFGTSLAQISKRLIDLKKAAPSGIFFEVDKTHAISTAIDEKAD